MLTFDLREKFGFISDKFIVLELNLIPISSYFMEIVHIELYEMRFTCLTKEDMLECLKYLGRTTSSKARRL